MRVLHAVMLVVAHVLGDDPVEQAFFGLAEVGDRIPLGVACFAQGLERGLVQGLLAGADLVQPLAVFGIGDRVGGEVHLGEARAAVVRRHAREFTGLVGDQVELGLHRSHRVDHAAQVRDEERIHHRIGRDLEVQWRVDRELDFVDDRHLLFRIDEQPLPVQRDRLDGDRLDVRIQRTVRIQCVRRAPGQDRQDQHDHARDRPHHHLDRRRVGPLRLVAGLGVGGAILPRERQGHDDDRDDDQQHEHGGRDQQGLLILADLALRTEDGHGIAAGEHHQQRQQQARAQPAPKGFQRNHRSIQLRGNAVPRPCLFRPKPVPPVRKTGRQVGSSQPFNFRPSPII